MSRAFPVRGTGCILGGGLTKSWVTNLSAQECLCALLSRLWLIVWPVGATLLGGPGLTRPHGFLRVANGNGYACWIQVSEVKGTLGNVSSTSGGCQHHPRKLSFLCDPGSRRKMLAISFPTPASLCCDRGCTNICLHPCLPALWG